MKKLILLDRDGVINVNRDDSVKSIHEFHPISGSLEAISLFKKSNLQVAVVTNQAIVGRGIITEDQLNNIHDYMNLLLSAQNIKIKEIFSCTSADDSDPRRKPNPGLLIEALSYFNVLPHEAILIGDSLRDIVAASLAGCHRYLVLTGHGQKTLNEGIPDSLQPLKIAKDLLTAAKNILNIE